MARVGRGALVLGDCLDVLRHLPSDAVTLAVTSPPYLNAINYSGHVEKLSGKKTRWEREAVSYDEYREFLVERFKELFRVIHPGGHNVVNIAPVGWQGRRTPLPFHFVGWMEQLGWTFKEDIVWEKPIARDRRSGVLMQHPYPGYYYPSLVAEYVLVFQKPGPARDRDNIYWFRSEDEKECNRLRLTDYQGEKSKNVWKVRPLAPQENLHPCPFPTELVGRVIEFYSYKGDWVLDIFTGSGQTNIAAEERERRHIGIDTTREYFDYAEGRLRDALSQQRLFETGAEYDVDPRPS
ncbi:site-specific DNA-methyltransferase [Candidatus Poribacteria bacterium]|nr:site-specific DNA-methyltransferase [Candidatus Poribacteria bacterium]